MGVIGVGYWGPNLVRNFAEMRSVELVAISDLNEKRLESMQDRYPQVYTTTDYTELFNMGLDAVTIATPPATHFAVVRECLEHNLHVLVEKPLTENLEEAEQLVMLSESRNLRLMVGHTFEYNSAVREIRRIIEDGELGEVYYIDAVRTNLGLFQLKTNAMWDLAPHDISIANYLLGTEPLSVTARAGSFVMRRFAIPDLVYMHIEYPGGILASIRVSWLDPNKTRRTTVVGSKKMLVYDDAETLEKIRIYDKGVETPPYTENYGEFQCSYRYGDVTIPYINSIEPLRFECQHFVDCILNGWTPQSDGRSGMRVVAVLQAAEESIQTGKTVEIPSVQGAAQPRPVQVPSIEGGAALPHTNGRH